MNTIDLFNKVLHDLKAKAKIRTTFSSRLTENMANRFSMMIEDVQRVNKKVNKCIFFVDNLFVVDCTSRSSGYVLLCVYNAIYFIFVVV